MRPLVVSLRAICRGAASALPAAGMIRARGISAGDLEKCVLTEPTPACATLVRISQQPVDSELSCPVLVAPHMSASSGSVLPRGTVGNALALSTFPQAAPPSGVRRRIFHRGAASAPR